MSSHFHLRYLSLTSRLKAFYIANMADSEHFNRLVSNLTIEERQNLFQKLSGQTSLSDEPLFFDDEELVSAEDIETEYSLLPWYYRLWYLILSLFKARSPVKIFEDSKVSVLGNKIEDKTPGLYDFNSGMLLPVFYRQMEKLKEAAHFFYSALDAGVNRDRGAFFAFLGSLEMPDIHKRLQEETEPSFYGDKKAEASVTELRQMAVKAMDDALTMVSEDNRAVMYINARYLVCLKELSSFLYDRLLMAFSFSSAVGGETCSVGVVRELLVTLNNILLSLRVVPSIALLESLFVFKLQEKAGEPGFDINREIRLLLSKAEEALSVIRDFNKQVPITWILRCFTRNMSISPLEISGGEDWFVVYREYWRRRIDLLFADYQKDRRQRELMESFRYFFKGKSLKILENAQNESNSDGMPIKGAFALSFLYTFYSAVFMPEINWILRPILIDGEFQRGENRLEFTEGYNNLIKLEDEIKKFDHEISPLGDYGGRYMQARKDMSSLPVKRRKIQIVTEEAQGDAEKILEQAQEASNIMVNILGGILGRDSRGKYFTLNNLTKLAGKDGRFITGIGEVILQFQRVLKLLEDIETMESGR